MTPQYTREELRADMQEITTAAIKASNSVLIRMINEDFAATNQRIDDLSSRMDNRFKQVEQKVERVEQKVEITNDKIDFTHKLLHVHIANPSAHSRH